MILNAARKRSFQTRLASWFRKEGRDLPWRRIRTPYATWISEMMLQQTQVKTMLPYFERWMRQIPTIEALDRTPEDQVLLLWQGLGYYNRARQLKKAARVLVEKYGGRIPDDPAAILEIPGIGPYSAGAILSLAYNRKITAVDGNILRVFSRLFLVEDPIDLPPAKEKIRLLEEALLPDDRPGEFIEALMELGALICAPKNPACGSCPVQGHCAAFKAGRAEDLPRRSKRKEIRKVEACAVILERSGRYYLVRRPLGGIMGGFWEFPEWKGGENLLSKHLGQKTVFNFAASIKRHYTRFAETLRVYRAKSGRAKPYRHDWESRWVSRSELERYPLTSAHSKIRKLILDD